MTTPTPGTSSLSWPPPALESIHGKLWPAIAVLGLADIVLVLPLLVSLGTHQPLGSLGPFGDAFWVPLATTFFGSVALVGGLWRLTKLLRGARTAAQAGHGWRTILAAAADEPRDTGFLLIGARSYASLSPSERDTIVAARILAASASLAAVLLAPACLSLSIVLGRLGVTGESFLWITALWIPVVLCAGGVFCATAARLLARSARASRPATAPPHASLQTAVTQWNAALNALRADRPAPVGKAAKPAAFGIGAVAVLVLAFLVVAPAGILTLGGTIGSILASIATPNFSRTRARLAAAEALRRYRLDPDPSISAETAGQALHAVFMVGQTEAERKAPERKPVRAYPDPWWPIDSAAPTIRDRPRWVDSLFARRRYPPAETAFLRRVASHPAHAEFAPIARARAADVIGTRYQLPFGPNVTFVNLPWSRFGNIREGARAHVAKAALELADGRPAQAEQTIREVISVGFLLMDGGPTLVDNLVGSALINLGGDALQELHRATGRRTEAETLAWVRAEARQAAERAVAGQEEGMSAEAGLRAIPQTVLDSTQATGLRWEFMGWTAVFAPCASIKTLAFGPGADYARWLDAARKSLVRRPSDEALLALVQRGPFGTGGCLPLLGGLRVMQEMR